MTLSDFDDLGFGVVPFVAEAGEIVPAACEFKEQGLICLFFH